MHGVQLSFESVTYVHLERLAVTSVVAATGSCSHMFDPQATHRDEQRLLKQRAAPALAPVGYDRPRQPKPYPSQPV
jgi:hypothetical protein